MAHRAGIPLRTHIAGSESGRSRHRRGQARCGRNARPGRPRRGPAAGGTAGPGRARHRRAARASPRGRRPGRTRENAAAPCATRCRSCSRPRKSCCSQLAKTKGNRRTRTHLSDVTRYLARHQVSVAEEVWRQSRGPIATELLQFACNEKADLIVAGGYGHSRLGEWIFGGVTHELLATSPMCCMLSH